MTKSAAFPADKSAAFPADKTAAAAAEFSGLGNVREVRMEMVIVHLAQAFTRGKKVQTSAEQKSEQKDRQKKMEYIKKDMLEKIHMIDPNFNEELKEELRRSQRGEHVFNNNILKFHCKVLDDFIQEQNIDNLQRYNPQEMDTLRRQTLTQNAEEEIQTNMVVHFGEDEFYVNANAVIYGVYCRALRGALLNVLRHINPGEVAEEKRHWVNFVINTMNNYEIYVDQMAKVRWIANIETRRARFERVKQEVVTMYNTDRGYDWCISILHEVAGLFEHRQ